MPHPRSEISPDTMLERIRAAGVVGAGGAGFPTHVKLRASVDTVIANGAECEPMLHADQHVMARYPDEVVAGLRLAMIATGAERGIIALKREYETAVTALSRVVTAAPDIQLYLMDSFYPAGDEFILVHDAVGRLVPEGGLPLQVGVVVLNVGTLQQIARAMNGEAVTHRYVTVAGEVERPCTLRVPIGTTLGQAIDWAGGPAGQSSRSGDQTAPWSDLAIVVGGPMMGKLVTDLSEPVTKTTSGLLVLPRDNVVVRYMERPLDRWIVRGSATCDQCRDCTTLCPRYLLGHDFRPHEIMRVVGYGLADHTEFVTAAVMCCECRLCEAYACPLELSPMALYVEIKRELQASGWRNTVHRRSDLDPHPYRDYRRVPMRRLFARLDLTRYEHAPNPLDERQLSPQTVAIPLQQHIGAPATPTVKTGQAVRVGELVGAIPEGKLGAAVHASIGGTVTGVEAGRVRIRAE